MTFELIPAYDLSAAQQADIANRAFRGYLAGWAEMDAAALARFLSAQGADLCHSRFAARNGKPVAFGYINRTGEVCRLSGMATVPEARRTGAAAWLLNRLLDEARQRRDRLMTLEVFEQNPGAVELYQKNGFRTVTRLLSWRKPATMGNSRPSDRRPNEIDLMSASQWPSAREYPEIPWQISRNAVAKLPVARAFNVDGACVVLGDTSAAPIRLHACFAPSQDWPLLREALSAVMNLFPTSEFFAPALFPEDFSVNVLEPLAFKREPLNQFYMTQALGPGTTR